MILGISYWESPHPDYFPHEIRVVYVKNSMALYYTVTIAEWCNQGGE